MVDVANAEAASAIATSGRWRVVSGIVAIYFVFGLSIGVMAPMVDEIGADLGLNRSTMGTILGAWPLIYIFTAIPCGLFVDRVGVRISMLLGGISVVVTFALRALAVGGVSLFLAVAVFGVGGPLVSIATPKAIATLFDEAARRLPVGFSVAAPTLGTAVGLALPDPVLLPAFDGNWRAVLWLAAAVAVVATVYWLWASSILAPEPIATDADKQGLRQRLSLLRVASLRWILILSVLTFAFSHGLNGWFPEILVDSGLTEESAGLVAAGATLLGIGGGLSISRIVPTQRRPQAVGVLLGLMAFGAAGLVTLGGAPLVVVALVLGFVRAGIVPMLLLGIIDDPGVGLAGVGAATGLLFSISQFGGFGGPTTIGALAERSGDFDTAGAFLVIVCIAALGVTIGWHRSLRRQAPTQLQVPT